MFNPSVVLDLEETLISITPLPPPYSPYLKLPVPSIKRNLYIRFRPHLARFFDELIKNKIEIFFFTSMPKKVAIPVIDALFSNQILSSKDCCLLSEKYYLSNSSRMYILPDPHRFYRENCLIENGYYVKDLTKISELGLIDLNRTVLIDDTLGCAQRNPHLHIPIKPWLGNTDDDTQLLDILPIIFSKLSLKMFGSQQNLFSKEVEIEDTHPPSTLMTNGIINCYLGPNACKSIRV